MLVYNKVLLDHIELEKEGLDYICPEIDKEVFQTMLHEINFTLGTNICYLAEIDSFNIKGAGTIMAKYITEFRSESVRAFLIPQMVADRISDCDKIVFRLYQHFRASDEYISKPEHPSPAHIYVRYDNSFCKLKPKRLAFELLELIQNPRDAYYLPFTTRMLASWKCADMLELLLSYADNEWITAADVGIDDEKESYYPPLTAIKRELMFTAILSLKYYPSREAKMLIETFANSKDRDVKAAAKKTLKAMQ